MYCSTVGRSLLMLWRNMLPSSGLEIPVNQVSNQKEAVARNCYLLGLLVSPTLKMEAIQSSETSTNVYWTTQHYIPDMVHPLYDPGYVILLVGNLTEERVYVCTFKFPTGI
jgi:hypothetical protein